MNRYFLLAAFAVYLLPALAQDCEKKLISYKDFKESDDTKWHLELKEGNSTQLYYFGANHSSDTLDKQFASIKEIFNKVKPDVVFFEGPNRGVKADANTTIAQLGESGYIRFLGKENGIEVLPLEPSPLDELKYIQQYYSVEQIKLFYLLREAQRVRDRKNYSKEDIEKHIQGLMQQVSKMFPDFNTVVLSIPELEAAFIKYWGTEIEWWQAPSSWFDPLGDSKATGGIFTNDINRLSSEYRNYAMYSKIVEQLKQGKKVMAVVGRNHVPMQAEAIKCAIGK